jgi:hypothetical protein
MIGKPRIVSWFSAGDASAVCTKLVLAKYVETHEIAIARCIIAEEHPDNDRFAADCVRWFNAPVLNLKSREYESCQEVWEKRRYMAGIKGAPCTTEMKKMVRHDFERNWMPDLQAFGYTVEEADRAQKFRDNNPDVRLVTPLIDAGLTKDDCHAMIARAGIEIPTMYKLGFNNNNCIGCVKAQSPIYWNRIRKHFPQQFEARAILSREIGARLVKLSNDTRLFLDELDPSLVKGDKEPALDCSLLCVMAEDDYAAKVA